VYTMILYTSIELYCVYVYVCHNVYAHHTHKHYASSAGARLFVARKENEYEIELKRNTGLFIPTYRVDVSHSYCFRGMVVAISRT